MNMKRHSRIGLAVVAACGLMFAGCAKKTTVDSSAGSKPAAASTAEPSTQAVSRVQEPSSHSVYFAFDSSALDAAAQSILDANADWLNANPDKAITIEGNCDERGSREYNLALGQRRADAVKAYLVNRGVDGARISTVSFGEERPVCKGTGEACWAQNRRADIVVR